MKVSELIKALEKCNKDCEVFFEEGVTEKENALWVGSIKSVTSVFEVGVREHEENPWHVERVVLSHDE